MYYYVYLTMQHSSFKLLELRRSVHRRKFCLSSDGIFRMLIWTLENLMNTQWPLKNYKYNFLCEIQWIVLFKHYQANLLDTQISKRVYVCTMKSLILHIRKYRIKLTQNQVSSHHIVQQRSTWCYRALMNVN